MLLCARTKRRHDGLTGHTEFFAATTEACFGVGNFFPFLRAGALLSGRSR
jgi:hypothetical protein